MNLICFARAVLLGSLALLGAAARAQSANTFVYQGRLSVAGAAYSGSADFKFKLYDSSGGITVIGPVDGVSVPGLSVANGVFTAHITFGANVFSSSTPRWLEVSARTPAGDPGDPTGYAIIAPRQLVSFAPASMFALAANQLDAPGGGPKGAVAVDSSGRVGMGTLTPATNLHVFGGAADSVVRIDSNNPGDAAIVLTTLGQMDWVLGLDRSDGGALKVGPSTTVGGNTFFTITPNGDFGIGGPPPGPNFRAGQLVGGSLAITGRNGSSNFGNASDGGSVFLSSGNSGNGSFNAAPGGDIVLTTGLGGTGLTSGARRNGVMAFQAPRDPVMRLADLSSGGSAYDLAVATSDGSLRLGRSALASLGTITTFGLPSTLVITSSNNVGINTTSTNGLLFVVNGTAGKPGGGSWSSFSDSRLKHDVRPMEGTLDRLLSLRGYSFEYNADAVRDRMAIPGRQLGLLAEEVEKIFPDWVEKDTSGYRYVTERATTALMVEALRDLRAEKDREIAEKTREISELKARLDRLEAALQR